MSLYGDYIFEREGKHIVENEHGFATYILGREECYLVDIFVSKEKRRSRLAWEMADKVKDIAKEHGCKVLTGTVCVNAFGVTESIKTLLAYGFKFYEPKGEMLWFVKEI